MRVPTAIVGRPRASAGVGGAVVFLGCPASDDVG
jgi:hypothetical protein